MSLLTTRDLYDYQLEGVASILNKKQSMLLLKPGLGKTPVCLKALSYLKQKGKIQKTLIIAPIHVCTDVWPIEAKKWSFSKDLVFNVIRGSVQERTKKINQNADVYLINYELLKWFCEAPSEIKYDFIVFDEVSMVANTKSQRFKAAKKHLRDIPWRVGLTGSPVGNSLINVFGEAYTCCGSKPLGDNFYVFRSTFFQPDDYIAYKWNAKKNAKRSIFRAVSRFSYSYIPKGRTEPVFNPITCTFRASTNNLIQSVIRDRVLKDQILRGADIPNKISQIESGFFYTEEKINYLHNNKIEKVSSLINELEGESLLVFYRYIEDYKRLHRIGFKGKSEPNFIEKWNSKQIKYLALHPKSVGHGINLQHGGSNVLFYGLPWSVELFDQAIGRLHRIGQQQIVNVYYFDTPQEYVIFRALKNRLDVEQELIERVNSLRIYSDVS